MLAPEIITTSADVFYHALRNINQEFNSELVEIYIKDIKEYVGEYDQSFIYHFILAHQEETSLGIERDRLVRKRYYKFNLFVTPQTIPVTVLGQNFRHIGQVPDIHLGIYNTLPRVFTRHHEYMIGCY